jgi:hypothetical protein
LDFWILVDTYNPDVIIGKESWLREEISNAKVFRYDYTTFRRDRNTRGGEVFICVKDYIACTELWVDEVFEMIAVEVKGSDLKFTWEVVDIYRATNEGMRVIERLVARTDYLGNSTKRSIIGVDVNLPSTDWNDSAECTSGSQAFLNRLVREHARSRYSHPRGCIAGCLFCQAGKFVHLLQHSTGDQLPLWGIIRSRMGRKLLPTSSRKTSPGIP